MKHVIQGLLLFSFLTWNHTSVIAKEKELRKQWDITRTELEGTITLSGSWSIYPVAIAWGTAFQKLHQKVKVDVSPGGAGKGVDDIIGGLVDIGMVSRDPEPSEIRKGIVPVYVLHDATFLIINDKNPALQDVLKKGIKKEMLNGIYITGFINTWNEVVDCETNMPLHAYTRSDSCGSAASLANYLGKTEDDLKGIGIYSDPGILEAVKKDQLGIAYVNFIYVFEKDGTVCDGIKIIPFDFNNNDSADSDEIIEHRDAAIKVIDTGKYPIARKDYFFIKEKPKELVKEFIRFALSDEGAKIVDIIPLSKQERERIWKNLEPFGF